MNENVATARRIARCAALAAALSVLTAALPAFADRGADIAAYNRRPRSGVAMSIAESFLESKSVGAAANWAERALLLPDSGGAHARALRLLERAKWALRDSGFGRVEIYVSPARATLRIDDQVFLPTAPRYRVWLPNGSHQMHVSLAGFTTAEQVVSARAGEERTVRASLSDIRPATLTILVYPVTAEIWIDGAYAGLSTRKTFSAKAGRRLLEARADGYVSYTDALDLEPNAKQRIEISLERAGALRRGRPAASNVDRPLTPLERANRGERHNLGARPHDRLRSRDPRPHMSGGAQDARPNEREEAPEDAPPPPRETEAAPPPPAPIDAEPEPEPTPSDPGAGIDAGVSSGGPMSGAMLKGLIWSGVGVTLIGAGVGVALYGVSQAQVANDLSLGNSGYGDYYDYGATMTYAGYGVAGVGAIATGIGIKYLFGKDGLPRRSKGLLLLGSGAVAAGIGGWLMQSATTAASAAADMPLRDPRYDAAFDAAEANWRAGAISAGVGGVALLAGAWMAITGNGGRTAALELVPEIGRQRQGLLARLHF